MRAPRRHSEQGLTLIEVAIVVSLVGILLAVFVPTFLSEVRTNKVAEASEQLLALERLTQAYYAAGHDVDGRTLRACLPSPAGPAPLEPSRERVEVDFLDEETPGAETWRALGFDPGPIRYRYSVLPHRVGCGVRPEGSEAIVTFRAEGDLDGDGVLSRFERKATARADLTLAPVDILYVENRLE